MRISIGFPSRSPSLLCPYEFVFDYLLQSQDHQILKNTDFKTDAMHKQPSINSITLVSLCFSLFSLYFFFSLCFHKLTKGAPLWISAAVLFQQVQKFQVTPFWSFQELEKNYCFLYFVILLCLPGVQLKKVINQQIALEEMSTVVWLLTNLPRKIFTIYHYGNVKPAHPPLDSYDPGFVA